MLKWGTRENVCNATRIFTTSLVTVAVLLNVKRSFSLARTDFAVSIYEKCNVYNPDVKHCTHYSILGINA